MGRALRRALQSVSSCRHAMIASGREGSEDAELLAASAPLARLLAERLCGAKLGRDSCAALHGVWQDLRRAGLAATPARHAAFFLRFLGRAQGTPRILVSGAADYGMLEMLAAARLGSGARCEATVLDLCPTPLLLCAWYGARMGIPVRTLASDLLAHREPEAFDLVCTHSLLRSFAPASQGEAVARWHELLRPGGALVTVTRIDPEGGGPAAGASPEQADALATRAAAEARARPDLADLDPAAFAERARRFAAGALGYPVGSERDLAALFEAQGFAIEHLEVRRVGGSLTEAAHAPGVARAADYAELVAVRQ